MKNISNEITVRFSTIKKNDDSEFQIDVIVHGEKLVTIVKDNRSSIRSIVKSDGTIINYDEFLKLLERAARSVSRQSRNSLLMIFPEVFQNYLLSIDNF